MEKKIIFALASILFFTSAVAQLNSRPQSPNLPTPKIPPLKPASLQTVSVSLNSATFNTSDKTEYINVKIAIKNIGNINSVATKMVGSLKDATGNVITTNDNVVDIPVIQGGQTYMHDCVFKFASSHFGNAKRTVNCRVNLASQAVAAVDGSNNVLTGILIGL